MEAQKKGLSLKQMKRSPLQNLNALQFHKSDAKTTSIAPASAGARNGCLSNLLSSNSSSDASLPSSSSSRTRLQRKPRSLPKIGSNFSVKSLRSKENELPRKPFSENSKKKRGIGKSNTNPVSKAAEMSKLSCGRGNSLNVLKKGVREPPFMSSTPVGSSGVRRNAAEDSNSDSRAANGGSGSATSAKTPPVEVSVSPEIQSKMAVSRSAATPVCYGAGHLLSGVTDKRKCRRRGSLRGGCEKVNLFDDEQSEKNVVDDLKDSLIPLPSEASVRWLLSPCNEGGEDRGSDLENKLQECCGNASPALDLLSSPSILCELGCENSEFRANVIRKGGIFMHSPEFECFLQSSVSNCNSVSLGEGKNGSGNSSAVSLGSLSSGNIIQTPSSDCSSYEWNRRSKVEVDHRSFVKFELDSITETPDADAVLDSSSRSVVPIQLEKNVDSVCSWESSSTVENLTLSQMRISWRDGVECRIDEHDELDCCPCLSDEEIDAFGCCDQQQLKDPWMDNVLLEYEPDIRAAPKGKSTGDRPDSCAESICTNGGGDLAVSCDSDWANIEESHLIRIE